MSTRPRLASLATDALADEVRSLDRAERGFEPDPAMIDAIGKAIVEHAAARRRRRRAIEAGIAACVAAAASVFLFRTGGLVLEPVQGRGDARPAPAEATTAALARPAAGGVKVIRGGREAALDPSGALSGGDRLAVDDRGSAQVDLSTGTSMSLLHAGEMTIEKLGDEQLFRLDAGSLRLDVARLRPGQRFIVRTPDSEVEVRGTSFQVDVGHEACRGSSTRVHVAEGVVVVRFAGKEDRITAGGEWPVGCVATNVEAAPPPIPIAPPPGRRVPAASPPPVVASAAHGPPPTARPAAEARPDGAGPPAAVVPASELAEQNRLYSVASAARRRGATSEALAAYDTFLSRYPSAQLAESAAVERMRLLAGSDRAGAASAAREYLAHWPRGFARGEATEISRSAP